MGYSHNLRFLFAYLVATGAQLALLVLVAWCTALGSLLKPLLALFFPDMKKDESKALHFAGNNPLLLLKMTL